MTNELNEFSNGLAAFYEEKRLQDDLTLANMRAELPALIRNIPDFDAEELMHEYDSCLNGHYSDIRRLAIAGEYKEAIRREIVNRMVNS